MSPNALALHVLRSFAALQRAGQKPDLQVLAERLGVRRGDVRAAVTSLHREGYLDLQTMRLTLPGFALGTALATRALRPLRAKAALTNAA